LLKKYHREQILKSDFYVQGIKWTVDPLLPNNAYLNFAKLGCISNTYKINYYGDPDRDGVAIYAGVPTDRFLVEWPVHSDQVAQRVADYKIGRISLSKLLERSPAINEIDAENTSNRIVDELPAQFCVEVPAKWQILRINHIDIAKDWRLKFRDICVTAFREGFYAIDYHSLLSEGKRRNFYEFSKKKPE
jgi:predicted GNAT superfamily acetyltransferase